MRYFQPHEYQYVSQYTPDMMELDYRKGQELVKQEDTFDKELFDASNNYIIKNPGHLSKQEDVDKANNFMKSNLDKIASDVTSGKLNSREGANRIKQLSDFYKTDKAVQGLLMDSQATWGEKGFESQRSTGKLKQGVGSFGPYGRPGSVYIDESNQLHVEKADAKDLKDLVGAGAYGVEIPKNALEKYKEFYSYIKPETIAQEIERPGFSVNKDGQNYVYSTNKGSFTREEVTRQALRNLATPFVNANMETNPDYEWDRRINMTDVYGFDAAREKEINRVVDSFPGYYKKEATKDEATINPYGSNNDGQGKTNNDYSPVVNPTPGQSTERGIKNIDSFSSNLKAFFNKGMVGNKVTAKVINGTTKYFDSNNKEVDPRFAHPEKNITLAQNWSTLPQEHKNLIAHYFSVLDGGRGTSKWAAFAKDIREGKNMDWLQNQSVYKKQMEKDLSNPKFLEKMKAVDIHNNNYIEAMNKNPDYFYAETGIEKKENSPATLGALIASPLWKSNNNWMEVQEDGSLKKVNIKDEYKDYTTIDALDKAASVPIGIQKYKPENNLSILVGDGNNWGNTFNVNIGGKEYVVPKGRNMMTDNVRKANNLVHDIYTNLVLGLPGTNYKIPGGRNLQYNDDENIFIDNNGNMFDKITDAVDNINKLN